MRSLVIVVTTHSSNDALIDIWPLYPSLVPAAYKSTAIPMIPKKSTNVQLNTLASPLHAIG